MAVEIYMPKMSDHMEEGEIIQWLVEEGVRVEQGQVILELMTDKAVAELESPATGVLKGIRVGAEGGRVVPVGTTFAFIAEPEEEVPVLPALGAETPTKAKAPDPPESVTAAEQKDERGKVRATPVARRLARELGVDLAQVAGTGPGGRTSDVDVRAYASAVKAAPPSGAEIGEYMDLSPIQRLTGRRMLESVQTAPQFALDTDVDMTNTLWLRNALLERIELETGVRPSVTAILTKVVGAALRKHPRANASFEDGRIRLHEDVNVGVAVGTEDGLLVPVIKHVDEKQLAEIVLELKAFQEKAGNLRFTTEELSGGTFTISNLGMYGITRFYAIVNPPQSAILAVGRIMNTPTGLENGSVELRPVMNLTLSVDHRALDGLQGARFLAEIKQGLENPYFIL
jgi:pyruvate dehydrogenase E2 component (dihydrolipoamide acetyltransferase)